MLKKVIRVSKKLIGNSVSFTHAYSLIPVIATAIKDESGALSGMGMNILYAVIGIVVTIIVLANAIPELWPLATEASGNITAMTGTDAGTTTIQAFWPIALLMVGLGVGVGVIVYALKQFGILT